MTVNEFIKRLRDMKAPEARVIIMGDPEGNDNFDVDEFDYCGIDAVTGDLIDSDDADDDDEVAVTIWPKHREGN